MKTKNLYFIEVTDTYGGEANYSWVLRYLVPANSFRGAISKLAKKDGAGWKFEYSTGDMVRYNLTGCAVCCFVELVDPYRAAEILDNYFHVMEF